MWDCSGFSQLTFHLDKPRLRLSNNTHRKGMCCDAENLFRRVPLEGQQHLYLSYKLSILFLKVCCFKICRSMEIPRWSEMRSWLPSTKCYLTCSKELLSLLLANLPPCCSDLFEVKKLFSNYGLSVQMSPFVSSLMLERQKGRANFQGVWVPSIPVTLHWFTSAKDNFFFPISPNLENIFNI